MRRPSKRLLAIPAAVAAGIGLLAFGHFGSSHPAAAKVHTVLAASFSSKPAAQTGSEPRRAAATTADPSPESGSEAGGESDGPGGWADQPGANADTQQEGQH